MDDAYAAQVTTFINTHPIGVEARRGIRVLHALGCPPTLNYLILVVRRIPPGPDDDAHFWFADRGMLAEIQAQGDAPDHPLDLNTATFVEAQFAYQPTGYYALLVINLEQSRSIVTWLPQPASGQ